MTSFPGAYEGLGAEQMDERSANPDKAHGTRYLNADRRNARSKVAPSTRPSRRGTLTA
jgi:hypothetical protein